MNTDFFCAPINSYTTIVTTYNLVNSRAKLNKKISKFRTSLNTNKKKAFCMIMIKDGEVSYAEIFDASYIAQTM